jgi:hypothetical protein
LAGSLSPSCTTSGTGKTHVALGLGLAACQKGLSVGFTTAASLVHELMEARDEKRLLRFQKQLASYRLLIIDELGFVLLSKTGAELLFEVFSLRYERGSVLVTSNLPFDEWTEVFGSERLTGALLDRLTHHVHILEMNGESYRLSQSKSKIPRLVGGWYTFAPPNWPTFSPAFTVHMVKHYARLAGVVGFSPHKWRHLAITAYLRATDGDMRGAQRLSRHSKLETLMVYDDAREDLQGRATRLLSELA